jgi:hypothetical protein
MLCLSYYCYVFFSTKLEKRANRFHLEARGLGGEGWDREQGREMAQTMYPHMNK